MIDIYVSGDDLAPCVQYRMHDEVTHVTFRVWDSTWEYEERADFSRSKPRQISGREASKLIRQQREHRNTTQYQASNRPHILRRRFKQARQDNQ